MDSIEIALFEVQPMLRLLCLWSLSVLMLTQVMEAQTAWPKEDWEVATPASQGMDVDVLEKARTWLMNHQSKSGLVVRHGRIVAEWYFDGADRNSKFAAYSTSKSLSSMATGLAIADGKLKLDDTVGTFRPDVTPEKKRNITVKQLLSMNSGVHNDPTVHLRDDLFSYSMYAAPMDFAPGEKWDYNNTGLALLSPVFQKATGQQIDDFLNERLFRPIGISPDALHWERREDLAIPYSGCHTTGRSLGRIGLMVLHHGKWIDKQIVPADWLAESIAPSQEMNKAYGYLWWNNSTNRWPKVPADTYAALGKWDNNILIVPSLDLVVIRQSDLAPGEGYQIADYYQLVCQAVKAP